MVGKWRKCCRCNQEMRDVTDVFCRQCGMYNGELGGRTIMETGERGNVCGIIGLCIGWLIPIAGVVLGIIALGRREGSVAIGILSLLLGIVFWVGWKTLLIGL